MTRIGMVAFDLDGTLVDSVADVAHALNQMLREVDLPAPSGDKIRAWVGDGVRRLVKRALTGTPDGEPDAALYQRGLVTFRRAYGAHLAVETRLYPGARDVLRLLRERDCAIACITNKAAEFTEPLLEALALRSYFGVVLSGDSLTQRKPHPLPLLHAARQFGVTPQQACMVGDSRNDILAARAAGFGAVGVRYGYGRDLSVLKPDAMLDSLAELPPLLEKWAAGLAPASASRYV